MRGRGHFSDGTGVDTFDPQKRVCVCVCARASPASQQVLEHGALRLEAAVHVEAAGAAAEDEAGGAAPQRLQQLRRHELGAAAVSAVAAR